MIETLTDLIREGSKIIFDRSCDSTDVIRKVSYEILIKAIQTQNSCVTQTCNLLELDQKDFDELISNIINDNSKISMITALELVNIYLQGKENPDPAEHKRLINLLTIKLCSIVIENDTHTGLSAIEILKYLFK